MRYLAEKARRDQRLAKKRAERDAHMREEERAAKKARLESDERTEADIVALKEKAFGVLEAQLATSINGDLAERDLEHLSAAQKAAAERTQAMEANDAKRTDRRAIRLDGGGTFADDWDIRLT